MSTWRRVHEELQNLKDELGLKTLSHAVELLLDRYYGRGQAAGSDEDDGEARPMEEEEEEDERLPALLSYPLLAREEKAIKYFTELSKPLMDWVMNAVCEAVGPIAFFLFFALGPAEPLTASVVGPIQSPF